MRKDYNLTLDLSGFDSFSVSEDDGYVDIHASVNSDGPTPVILSAERCDEDGRTVGQDGDEIGRASLEITPETLSPSIPQNPSDLLDSLYKIKGQYSDAARTCILDLFRRNGLRVIDFYDLVDSDDRLGGDDAYDRRIGIDRWDHHDNWYSAYPCRIWLEEDGRVNMECCDDQGYYGPETLSLSEMHTEDMLTLAMMIEGLMTDEDYIREKDGDSLRIRTKVDGEILDGVDLFSIEEQDGQKVVHLSGYAFKSEANPGTPDKDWRLIEYTFCTVPLSEFRKNYREQGHPYVDSLQEEVKQYEKDMAEAEIIETFEHYFGGRRGELLDFSCIRENTPCGNYWN